MIARGCICLFSDYMLFPLCGGAQQQPIVADLSHHLVAIDTGFSG